MESPMSPQPASTLRYAAFTHPGKLHRRNQDAILVVDRVLQTADFVHGSLPLQGMLRFAVSDGVSGQPQPAAASRLLLENLLVVQVPNPDLTPQWCAEKLQTRISRDLDRYPKLEDAAATLVTAEVRVDAIRIGHAGDSRAYRIANGQAERLTHDHTTLSTLIAAGQLTARERSRLADTSFAKALDNLFVYSHYAEPPRVSVQTVTLAPGEVLVLVSDGVTNELGDREIAAFITADELAASARRLFDALMAKGANDDLSAILLASTPRRSA